MLGQLVEEKKRDRERKRKIPRFKKVQSGQKEECFDEKMLLRSIKEGSFIWI